MKGKFIIITLSILIFIFMMLVTYLLWEKNKMNISVESRVSYITLSINNEKLLKDKILEYSNKNPDLKNNIKNLNIILVPETQDSYTMKNQDGSVFMSYNSQLDKDGNFKILLNIDNKLLQDEDSTVIAERIDYLVLRRLYEYLFDNYMSTNEFIKNEKDNFGKIFYVEKI